MKQQSSIIDIATEVERQKHAKRDFIASTNTLTLNPPANSQFWSLEVQGGAGGEVFNRFEPTPHAHKQIGERLQIPAKYYDRMKSDHPQLLATNVNSWFRKQPERRMIRTLDGTARAFLSDRYRRLDNFDLMESVLPVLADVPDMRIESSALTETRMYIKATFPRIQGEVRKGDIVQFGVSISNSEIGHGAFDVTPLVFRLVCLNGMILQDSRVRKNHVGRAAGGGEEAYEIYSDETLAADDKALFLKVRDLVKATATDVGAQRLLARLRESTFDRLTAPISDVVEELSTRHSLNEGESQSVIKFLLEGGDLTRWGLANAVTATAQEVDSYDRATELERLGGTIIDLPANDWRQIAEAA